MLMTAGCCMQIRKIVLFSAKNTGLCKIGKNRKKMQNHTTITPHRYIFSLPGIYLLQATTGSKYYSRQRLVVKPSTFIF